jgi:tetratricopeptide (TPR) repeat protein
LVHYSKGQLSKVETGHKRPGPELARLCDAALGAGGKLAALVPARAAAAALPDTGQDSEVWLMHLGKDGSSWFRPLDRRQVVAAGTASLFALGIGGLRQTADTEGTNQVDASRSLFSQFRRLGQTSGPGVLLPSLIAQTHSMEQLAVRSGPRTRCELLVLASRYAEYTGWMAQESGNDEAAMWWTGRAVELAAAGEDDGLGAYSLVRRALISLFRGDVQEAVGLAGRALDSDAPPRVRGLAAQQRAQGHALSGDYGACMRDLDQARELLALDSADPAAPVIGTSNLSDVVSMYTGWCLYDLGRPRLAAEALDRETARIPAHALRSRARYGVRRALAHAADGEIDHACELARGLLGPVGLVHSATISTDLRRLARLLGGHPRNASVRALSPDLTSALAATAS